MPNAYELKRKLREAIAGAAADGTYDEASLARVHGAVAALEPHSPIPEPAREEARVAGPWGSLFTQWGPAHTAGKPTEHDTTLATLSFNSFPKAPARLLSVEQEIHAGEKAYNNVHVVRAPDASEALFVIRGTYELRPEEPQRYHVAFTAAELSGAAEERLRGAFGLAADAPLTVAIKPPKLHSDVTYCDDELRINRGSLGGLYVMERLSHEGRSVSFS